MDIQRIVAELRGEMDRISHAIGLLEGNTTAKARAGRPPASTGTSPVGAHVALPLPVAADWPRR